MTRTPRRIPFFFALSMAALAATSAVAGDLPLGHTATSELEWIPTPFGPLASPISGDFTSAGHVTFIRFEPGMKTPLHTHSADYVGIVITGTTKHWVPGKPETHKLLPPGSHWTIPADLEHVSECLPGHECVMALVQEQAMDFLPVEVSSVGGEER